MSASRESIYAALFDVLQNAYPWVTCSRRLKSIESLNAPDFPAAYQLQGNQVLKYQGDVPTVGTWDASWLLYSYSDDPNVAPSTPLNVMVDAALAALKPADGPIARNTLGGKVEYAAAEGNIEIFEGVLGDRALAIVPIKILVPGF